jgi:hypothetical protein
VTRQGDYKVQRRLQVVRCPLPRLAPALTTSENLTCSCWVERLQEPELKPRL